jgi:serine phosphatase RsbU (regulator of sigma subunit)/tetratricopeptide (TPR) repeat protein
LHSIIIKGKVTELSEQPLSFAKIDVVEGNNVVKTINTDASGSYEFTLDKGKSYILNFNKYGYASKKIAVSTEAVSDDELKYGLFPIKFNISLFEYFPSLDINVLDKPVTKFYYSDYEGDFIYDEPYTLEMNKQIGKIITKLNGIKKEMYNKCIAEGKNLYSENKLEDALLQYQEAHFISPNEFFPGKQIDIILIQLKKQAKTEKIYASHILYADKNFEKQNYRISRSYYQKSLIYKPDEKYPQNRIQEIENLLAGNYSLINKVEKDASISIDTSQILANNSEKKQLKEYAETTTVNKNNVLNQLQAMDATPAKQSNIHQTTYPGIIPPISQINSEKEKTEKETGRDSSGLAKSYLVKGVDAYKQNLFDKALEFFNKAYEIYDSNGSYSEQALVAETMADVYSSMYRYTASSDWYLRAHILFQNSHDTRKSIQCLIKSAEASYSAGDMDQALSHYLQFLTIPGSNSFIDMASVYNSIGVIHFEMGNFDEALKYYESSIESADKTKNIKEKSMSYNNIGNVRYELTEYPMALQNYDQSIQLKNSIDYKAGIAVSFHNIANIYRKKNDYTKALEYYENSEKYAEASGNTDVIYENYGAMADIYSKMKDYNRAFYYYKLYSDNRHLIVRKQGRDQINETAGYYNNLYNRNNETTGLLKEIREQRLLSYYESSRKEKEIQYLNVVNKLNKQHLVNKESQVKIQRTLLFVVISSLALLLIFLFLLFRQNRQKKNANQLLAKQNLEINKQKQEIESQRDLLFNQKTRIEFIHGELTDSIKYASRIQNAVLSSYTKMPSEISENLVFFKPLGVVSGDFYWMYHANDKLIFCVADCTGHGVPGAFMSMLGISLLNEIVQKENITQPDLIENILRENLNKALGQKEIFVSQGKINVRDGMDIAIGTLNLTTMELLYAGANMPLYITRLDHNENVVKLIEFQPDKMPIGIYERMEPFTLHSIQIQKGDCLYLFSDGYTSQFGGVDGKKFNYKQFKELLVSNYPYTMTQQKENINKTFDDWKGNNAQIDDITIVGIRI